MIPTVSVIIPAWNASAYIDEALGSLAAQTLGDWEALVIDDASTDDTIARVAAAAERDPRVRLIRQQANAGPSAARNRGIAEARGTFIALLDADDAYEPARLANLVALAERHKAEMASDNLWLMPEADPAAAHAMIPASVLDGERALTLTEFIQRNVADPRYPGLNLGFLKPIVRRDFWTGSGLYYDERVRFAEDFSLYVDCFRKGARWWMMDAPTYRYRVRGDSLTQVQTVGDLGVLRAKLASLGEEAWATGNVELGHATGRQARVVDRCYYYRAFTDQLKARRYGDAFATVAGNRRAAMLVMGELARQLPIIARKAARGGYRARVGQSDPVEPPLP